MEGNRSSEAIYMKHQEQASHTDKNSLMSSKYCRMGKEVLMWLLIVSEFYLGWRWAYSTIEPDDCYIIQWTYLNT